MLEIRSRWTPLEVRKTIALVLGGIFFFFGIYLIASQVKEEGSFNIKSAFISGDFKSGSVSLGVCVLSVIIISISIIPFKKEQSNNSDTDTAITLLKDKSLRNSGLCIAFAIFLFLMIIFFPEVRLIAGLFLGVIVQPLYKALLSNK
jgi:hypothetical protein